MRFALLIALLISFSTYSANDLVAEVEMTFIKDTQIASSFACIENTDCEVFATFFLYEAKIKKVISGKINSKKVTVIYGRHSPIKQSIYGLAQLHKLESNNSFEADYQVLKIE